MSSALSELLSITAQYKLCSESDRGESYLFWSEVAAIDLPVEALTSFETELGPGYRAQQAAAVPMKQGTVCFVRDVVVDAKKFPTFEDLRVKGGDRGAALEIQEVLDFETAEMLQGFGGRRGDLTVRVGFVKDPLCNFVVPRCCLAPVHFDGERIKGWARRGAFVRGRRVVTSDEAAMEGLWRITRIGEEIHAVMDVGVREVGRGNGFETNAGLGENERLMLKRVEDGGTADAGMDVGDESASSGSGGSASEPRGASGSADRAVYGKQAVLVVVSVNGLEKREISEEVRVPLDRLQPEVDVVARLHDDPQLFSTSRGAAGAQTSIAAGAQAGGGGDRAGVVVQKTRSRAAAAASSTLAASSKPSGKPPFASNIQIVSHEAKFSHRGKPSFARSVAEDHGHRVPEEDSTSEFSVAALPDAEERDREDGARKRSVTFNERAELSEAIRGISAQREREKHGKTAAARRIEALMPDLFSGDLQEDKRVTAEDERRAGARRLDARQISTDLINHAGGTTTSSSVGPARPSERRQQALSEVTRLVAAVQNQHLWANTRPPAPSVHPYDFFVQKHHTSLQHPLRCACAASQKIPVQCPAGALHRTEHPSRVQHARRTSTVDCVSGRRHAAQYLNIRGSRSPCEESAGEGSSVRGSLGVGPEDPYSPGSLPAPQKLKMGRSFLKVQVQDHGIEGGAGARARSEREQTEELSQIQAEITGLQGIMGRVHAAVKNSREAPFELELREQGGTASTGRKTRALVRKREALLRHSHVPDERGTMFDPLAGPELVTPSDASERRGASWSSERGAADGSSRGAALSSSDSSQVGVVTGETRTGVSPEAVVSSRNGTAFVQIDLKAARPGTAELAPPGEAEENADGGKTHLFYPSLWSSGDSRGSASSGRNVPKSGASMVVDFRSMRREMRRKDGENPPR